MTGRSGIGAWEKSVLNFAFFTALVADAELVAYEGNGVGKTPYSAETMGFGYIVYGGAFTGGSRLSITLKTKVPVTTVVGFHTISIDAEAYNEQVDRRSMFQQVKFYVEALP